jgi:hypothetical protein
MKRLFRPLVLLLGIVCQASLIAAPREADWEKVDAAIKNDQPKTAAELLRAIAPQAFADQAWAEGAKAVALRIALEHQPDKEPAEAVRQLAEAIPQAPPAARPVLKLLEAWWLREYYQDHRWELSRRSTLTSADDADPATWDIPRLLAEIDRRFQAALADRESLRKTPVGDFDALLEKGDLPDALRPTLYDFIAHSALEFYALPEMSAAFMGNGLTFASDAPAFGSVVDFLAWQPENSDPACPKLRALRIYQDLLASHRADPDPTAFFHCDLERLRWANTASSGNPKHVDTAFEKALRDLMQTASANPVSADARLDLAGVLTHTARNGEAHAILKAGAAAFPTHPFGILCANKAGDLEEREMEIETTTHWTGSGEEIAIDHVNVSHVWFRAFRQPWQPSAENLHEEQMLVLSEDASDPPDTSLEDLALGKLLREQPAKVWDAPLAAAEDYTWQSTGLPAPTDLASGYYVIVASGQPGFEIGNNHLSVLGVHVSGMTLVVRSLPDRVGGLVTDARTGAPLSGVTVTCYSLVDETKRLETTKTQTGTDGAFSFREPDGYRSILVAESGNDRAILRANLYEIGSISDYKPVETLTLFTDRAIYRPGQTIQFKGVLWGGSRAKSDFHPQAAAHATIILSSPDRTETQRLDCVANEFGSVSGSFPLPAACRGGAYEISEDSRNGIATIHVEEYKRPKFTAAIESPAVPGSLGQPVTVTGTATAYTGAPVDGAGVRWHVKRGVHWPAWLRGAGFGGEPGESRLVAQGATTTAANGTFSLSFTAVPDPDLDPADSPVYDFEITADVTDPTGETRTVTKWISVAEATLKADLSGDDWLPSNQPVVLTVSTTTHDGIGKPATGRLTVYRLKEPAVCPRGDVAEQFHGKPGTKDYPLANLPDPAGWEPGEAAAELEVTTAAAETDKMDVGEAKASFDLTAGAYRAVFTAKDANGREFKALRNLQVVDPAADHFPTKRPFFTVCNSDTIQPGETLTLTWGSGHATARACIEWFHQDHLVKREWSAPGRTQQTFSFTPDESFRGGFTVAVTQTTLNSLQQIDYPVYVPWTNKELTLRWEHLTSKLAPGAADTWTAVITGPNGAPARAEMVATLYDASLDAFVRHEFPEWRAFDDLCTDLGEAESSDNIVESAYWCWEWESAPYTRVERSHRQFESASIFHVWPNPRPTRYHRGWGRVFVPRLPRSRQPQYSVGSTPPDPFAPRSADSDKSVDAGGVLPAISPRRNLRETAFFFPNLTSNEKGEIRLSFTMPEALTTWRFLGFAHDRELRSGFLEGETITAKDLMVQPNPPRFLREGDALAFTVKISNQSDREQSGTARLDLTDSATLKDATAALGLTAPEQQWTIPAKQSRTLSWRLSVPDGAGFLTYRATATAGNLTDGEEGWLPVLPRRIALTESMNLPIRDAGTREFVFQKLVDSAKSPTLEHRALQIQSVGEPAWYAVLALPYLMEFPHECAEQTFHRYYANALARHLVTSQPRLRQLLDQWQQTKALESPLANNPAASEVLLEETPWLAAAADQTQARRNLARFFDDNRLNAELDGALEKVKQVQRSDGLWPWFPGGPGCEHISLTIVTGFARLRQAGVKTNITPALKALAALDADLTRQFEAIRWMAWKDTGILKANHLNPAIAETLYTRTLFLKDRKLDAATQPAFDFFAANAKDHWTKLDSRMSRAHLALALHRLGDATTAKLITRSLREHATVTPDTGMAWRDDDDAWHWWQSPIETQALMIEAFREIDRDEQAVEDCRVWLITRKQTTDWGTTTATADAVHALLSGGRDLLANSAPLQVSLGGVPQTPASTEPGTGFHELDFAGPAVKPEFGKISLTKTTPGIAWAGVHWQYLEDLAKVTSHDGNGLKLEKTLFVRKSNGSLAPVAGPLKVGDELVTRLILRNDRPLEFVHLKDQRGSGTEPLNVQSGYRWQGGLGYYETTRDTASHFFIDALPVGTHVFETGVRIQHAGTYQTGIATIRCMYAPAFAAHSGSVEVTAE